MAFIGTRAYIEVEGGEAPGPDAAKRGALEGGAGLDRGPPWFGEQDGASVPAAAGGLGKFTRIGCGARRDGLPAP
ncbi:hypothetical protein TRIP_B360088 [uncultured Desulfatiglans sp.]|uniref:Uncharacterized protein n=1 Tax=Uncultured Desulfatiglans sp. TaxID=1748965 RepID=A0A652ZZS3_UNCDX|nr:hypothetical protein TRIP_B10009 [uncultured Desulfatiglans sp.]VBB45995.1 hypothetical protein TRIP_B360088 [uncultured Desulfatiglans sp.]